MSIIQKLAKWVSDATCTGLDRTAESAAPYRRYLARAPFPVYLLVSLALAVLATALIFIGTVVVIATIVVVTLLALLERGIILFYRGAKRDWVFYRSPK